MKTPVIVSLALFVTACAPLPPAYDFRPKAVEVQVKRTPEDPRQTARVLISLLDVGRGRPPETFELRARILIQNTSDTPITVRTGSMELVSADLERFGAPWSYPVSDPEIDPGSELTVDLGFPFPRVESLDLSTLRLRLTVESERGEVPVSVSFRGERIVPLYYAEPYWWDPDLCHHHAYYRWRYRYY